MFKHILVATDGSRLSDKAVDAAIGLARDLGAKLTGFYATQDYPISPFSDYAMVAGSLTPANWKADEEKRARRMLGKVEAKAKKAGVACDTGFSLALQPYEANPPGGKEGPLRRDRHGFARAPGNPGRGAGKRNEQGSHAQQAAGAGGSVRQQPCAPRCKQPTWSIVVPTPCKRRCVRCNSMRRADLWCYARWIGPFRATIRS